MSLTTVAELKAVLGVGSLYSDAILQEVCDASDAVLLPMLWADTEFNVEHSNTTTVGTLYFDEEVTNRFYVGQTVVVTNNKSHLNGSKTITEVGQYSISYAITGTPAAEPRHPVNPYGLVTIAPSTDWTADSAIQEASLMLSVDIFQARQVPSSGGVAIDGSASPWRMSNSLLAKIRGLIAHAIDPRSMVG
jgi:hypothetical protein